MISYEKYATIRDSKGLTDGKVAERAGIGRSTFSDWKSGRSVPKYDKMCKIADALGMIYIECQVQLFRYGLKRNALAPHLEQIPLVPDKIACLPIELKLYLRKC